MGGPGGEVRELYGKEYVGIGWEALCRRRRRSSCQEEEEEELLPGVAGASPFAASVEPPDTSVGFSLRQGYCPGPPPVARDFSRLPEAFRSLRGGGRGELPPSLAGAYRQAGGSVEV